MAGLDFTMDRIRNHPDRRRARSGLLKRIIISDQVEADIRAIPQHIDMNILTAIRRLAETGAGRVKMLQGKGDEMRLRVGVFRVRYTEAYPVSLRMAPNQSLGRVGRKSSGPARRPPGGEYG